MSMSCKPCRRAGDLLTDWKKGRPVLIDQGNDESVVPPKDEAEFYRFLGYLHNCCKGKAFCYCQHSTQNHVVAE